jgi:amidase
LICVEPEVAAAVEAQIATLTDLGATVTRASLDFTGADEVFSTLRALNYAQLFGQLADQSPELVKQAIHANVAHGRAWTGSDVARADALRGAIYNRALAFFGEYDALVLPACQRLPFDADLEYPDSIAGVPMENYLAWMKAAYFVSVTACPATAVPVGFSGAGLPIGVQVVAPPRDDVRALAVAHCIEQATVAGQRRPEIVVRPLIGSS